MVSPDTLLRCGAGLTLALLLVLATRRLVRRQCGARVAYALWLLPPMALLAGLLPAPVRLVSWSPLASLGTLTPAPTLAADPSWRLADLAPALWLAGVLVALCWQCWAQRRFVAALRMQGQPGLARSERVAAPLAVGLLRPRIVLPADFETRYAPEAQALMLAHERAHLTAGDLPAQAIATPGRLPQLAQSAGLVGAPRLPRGPGTGLRCAPARILPGAAPVLCSCAAASPTGRRAPARAARLPLAIRPSTEGAYRHVATSACRRPASARSSRRPDPGARIRRWRLGHPGASGGQRAGARLRGAPVAEPPRTGADHAQPAGAGRRTRRHPQRRGRSGLDGL
jgi:hypothetical protein